MSKASLQRQRDKGRGWTPEQREAYRQQRQSVRARKTIPRRRESRAAPVEAPIDTNLVDFP